MEGTATPNTNWIDGPGSLGNYDDDIVIVSAVMGYTCSSSAAHISLSVPILLGISTPCLRDEKGRKADEYKPDLLPCHLRVNNF
jgi:hypothetical protein